MCGRFTLFDNTKFNINDNFIPNYNIAPDSNIHALIEGNKVITINWALRPQWSKAIKIFNARSETIDVKTSFKKTSRCVFLANGYFEWEKENMKKIPYYHTFKNNFMFLAGVYDSSGACIVTRPSYPKLSNIHPRQPVMIDFSSLNSWFKKSHDYTCKFSEDIIIYPVSNKVNSVSNNSKENIRKIE